MKARAKILIANQANKNGEVFSKEALEKLAEENECFEFDGENLYHVMKMQKSDEIMNQVLEENFWDLI
jgi:hypothetical protein